MAKLKFRPNPFRACKWQHASDRRVRIAGYEVEFFHYSHHYSFEIVRSPGYVEIQLGWISVSFEKL